MLKSCVFAAFRNSTHSPLVRGAIRIWGCFLDAPRTTMVRFSELGKECHVRMTTSHTPKIISIYDHIRHPGSVPVFAPLLPPANGPFTSAGSKRHDSKLWSQTLEFAAASDLSTTFPAWELQTRNHRQTGAYSTLTVSLCNQIVD